MWIKIIDPADSNSDNWLGTLEKQTDFNGKWHFELIRSHDGLGDAYKSMNDFSSLDTLVGLLDFQKPCTLINPIVNNLDPGSIGVHYDAHRTILRGKCSAIIENTQITDLDELKIEGVTISSDSCISWLNKPKTPQNNDNNTALQNKEFSISGLGNVICRYGVSNSYYTWEVKKTSVGNISIIFTNKISTRDAFIWCQELELLFQFLIGHSTIWSKFSLKLDDTYELDNEIYHTHSLLEFGNLPHKENDKLHPKECRYLDNESCTETEKVLNKYHENRETLSKLIDTIWVCENISKTLQDKLPLIIPAYESYLKRFFTNIDEEEYIKFEQNFFQYIDKSNDENVIEFSKKHIQVIERKSASFRAMIERSIDQINSFGFSIDKKYAKQISIRRGKMFHGSLDIKDNSDAISLYEEYNITLSLLTLHVYIDLGLNVEKFKEIGFSGGSLYEFQRIISSK